jgi:hypothetical protein
MIVSSVVCYLISLRSKYSPQHFTVRYARFDITPTPHSGAPVSKLGVRPSVLTQAVRVSLQSLQISAVKTGKKVNLPLCLTN